jgi:hypothetical protein
MMVLVFGTGIYLYFSICDTQKTILFFSNFSLVDLHCCSVNNILVHRNRLLSFLHIDVFSIERRV